MKGVGDSRRSWVRHEGGNLIIDDLLDLIGGVGGIVGGEIVLLSVIFCSDEKGFEGWPGFGCRWTLTPTFTVLVKKACGLDVVVSP